MQQILYKVPGGKMLRVFLKEKEGVVLDIRITCDFFMHPEDNLVELEKSLVGIKLEEQDLLEKINSFLKTNPSELYGFAPQDLVTAILTYDYPPRKN